MNEPGKVPLPEYLTTARRKRDPDGYVWDPPREGRRDPRSVWLLRLKWDRDHFSPPIVVHGTHAEAREIGKAWKRLFNERVPDHEGVRVDVQSGATLSRWRSWVFGRMSEEAGEALLAEWAGEAAPEKPKPKPKRKRAPSPRLAPEDLIEALIDLGGEASTEDLVAHLHLRDGRQLNGARRLAVDAGDVTYEDRTYRLEARPR